MFLKLVERAVCELSRIFTAKFNGEVDVEIEDSLFNGLQKPVAISAVQDFKFSEVYPKWLNEDKSQKKRTVESKNQAKNLFILLEASFLFFYCYNLFVSLPYLYDKSFTYS
ncbi:MAG: hypothetical protein VX730_04935 [Pseudomonadota bacterium]|nr:hypothetical protein [Pseudomonadota bacterium]